MTFDLRLYALGLAAIAALSLAGWVIGTARRNVAVVDSLWGLFFLAATAVYVHGRHDGPRRAGAGAGRRLGAAAGGVRHVAQPGLPEDRRYAAIRARHEPGFAWKSLYVIFGLQALLAWVISLPQFAAASVTGAARRRSTCWA